MDVSKWQEEIRARLNHERTLDEFVDAIDYVLWELEMVEDDR